MRERELPRAFGIGLAAALLFGVFSAWAGEWAEHTLHTLLLLLGAGAAIHAAREGDARRPALTLPLVLVAVWGVLQIARGWSEYPFASWNAVCKWAAAAAAVYVGFQVLRSAVARERAGTIAIWFALLLSGTAILQWYTGAGRVFWLLPTGYSEGVAGPFLNRDHYAAFIEVLLPVALWRALRRDENALLSVLAAATMLASVIVTGSRTGSFLAGAEVLAFCGLASVRGGRSGMRLAGVVLTAGLAMTLIAGWEFLWLRLQEDDPLGIRRYMYQSAMAMVAERPLTGFGLGCWREVYPHYSLFDDGSLVHHAHNDWLEWAGEGGLPAAILMLAFAVMMTRAALRFPWGLGAAVVLVHALLDFPMQKAPLAMLVFVIAGALAAAAEGTQRRAGPGKP
jgi:O-antigen ligase